MTSYLTDYDKLQIKMHLKCTNEDIDEAIKIALTNDGRPATINKITIANIIYNIKKGDELRIDKT